MSLVERKNRTKVAPARPYRVGVLFALMGNFTFTFNPYYSENSAMFKTSMWMACIIGTLINGLGLYCDLYKYPKSMVYFYRMLNVYFLVISSLFHISFTGGTAFVSMLPYIAIFPVGFLRLFSVSTMSQYTLIMSLWAGSGSCMVAPFVCRMQLLLPKDNIINSPVLKAIVYFNLCVATLIVTPIIWYFFLSYSLIHQERLKQNAAHYFGLISSKLFESDTLLMNWDIDRPWVVLALCLISIGIGGVLLSIPACCAICFRELRKMKPNMSVKTRLMHKTYLTSLISQMTVHVTLFTVPMAFCAFLLYTESFRCDLFNLASVIVGISSPSGTLTMIATTRPYMKFVTSTSSYLFLGRPMSQPSSISITIGTSRRVETR